MTKTIVGKKQNMSQIFVENGKVIPVTIVKTEADFDEELIDKDVEVVGTSKGKGFSGVMKKWNFKGASRTHGQSSKARSGGSIGSQTPGRVLKGKKMAGRMGGEKVTIKGLKIVDVSKDSQEIVISGSIPGARNSEVKVRVFGIEEIEQNQEANK